jgi:CheY-like chemotaxis protein/HPt (histidine-containing phosphotransfer) domain-containing protein
VSSTAGSPEAEVPTLLDERVLADLHEDFASTGDLPELADLMRSFLERGAEQLADVTAAVHDRDGEAIRRAAHKMKGSSQTLGASLTGAVASKLEAAGEAGDMLSAGRTLPELEVVFALSRAALTDAIEALDGGGASAPIPVPAPPGGGLRALLADDEAISLAVLRASVERLGHECTAVTSGEAALAAYDSVQPQIVVTDLLMPGIDGVELARRIRARGDRSVYVVVLSATGERADAALGSAIDARLSKPVREDELRAVLGLAAQRAL